MQPLRSSSVQCYKVLIRFNDGSAVEYRCNGYSEDNAMHNAREDMRRWWDGGGEPQVITAWLDTASGL